MSNVNNKLIILICPYCHCDLNYYDNVMKCVGCHESFEKNVYGQYDFKIYKQKKVFLEVTIGEQEIINNHIGQVKLLVKNKSEKLPFSGKAIPFHLNKRIISHFPWPKNEKSKMLDLGCGKTIHKDICEKMGYEYWGLDYKTKEADFLGDAQALPFRENSFDFVLSMAVLEHIQHPIVMMNEVHRVLKPDGIFIGSVSFLEPFHEDSFYHHTHLGLINSILSSGFKIEFISPNESWNGLNAISQMALFPMLPVFIVRMFVWPINKLHLLWWYVGQLFSRNSKANKLYRLLLSTGSFFFKIQK